MGVGALRAGDKVVCVELRNRLDPANFAEVLQDVGRDALECSFGTQIEIPEGFFCLLGDCLLEDKLLALPLGNLGKHGSNKNELCDCYSVSIRTPHIKPAMQEWTGLKESVSDGL